MDVKPIKPLCTQLLGQLKTLCSLSTVNSLQLLLHAIFAIGTKSLYGLLGLDFCSPKKQSIHQPYLYFSFLYVHEIAHVVPN